VAAAAQLRSISAALLAVAALGCDGGQGSPSAFAAAEDKRALVAAAANANVPPEILPALTGRVVDQAGILSPGVEKALASLSSELERRTTDQLVIVTLPNLDGRPIEDVGLALGRGWGIGQKEKDNGVLLVVAPNERKVRIEVGYGLERILPDERAAEIIQRDLLPRFRQSEFDQGILAGAEAISQLLVSHASKPRVGKV
jgi:uncharacterized protein